MPGKLCFGSIWGEFGENHLNSKASEARDGFHTIEAPRLSVPCGCAGQVDQQARATDGRSLRAAFRGLSERPLARHIWIISPVSLMVYYT